MDILVVLLPTVVRKTSLRLPFSNTALVTLSFNDLVTSISRLAILYSLKTHQRSSCHIRSNAFLNKVDQTIKDLLLVFQILFHQQASVRSTPPWSETCLLLFQYIFYLVHDSLLRITRSMTLLGWLIRLSLFAPSILLSYDIWLVTSCIRHY